MKELVEVIAKALVDCPDEVSVSEKQEGRTTVLELHVCLLYTSPSPRDGLLSRMPSSA